MTFRPPDRRFGAMTDDRPSLLMVTVWARKGGAERLILDLLGRLDSEFRAALGFVRALPERERTLGWDGRTVGLREILFGSWDVIHTHLFLPGLLVRLRRIWDGSFRWVHTVHYEDYSTLRWGLLKRWLDRAFVFPAADVLVAVSSTDRVLLDRFPQTRLIENAIPLDPVPIAPSTGEEAVLGTVAHLRREKGLDELIRAFGLLESRRPGLGLRIAGEGPRRDSLEELVHDLELDGSVELCGFVGDVEDFYRSLDVYVQPSRSERFGLATLESMRFGLPVVAADAGFLPELLGGGRFGILVERGEGFPARLAEAVGRVLDDPERYRRRSEKGLAYWRPRLDPQRMAAEYRKAYADALEPRICMLQPVVTHASGGLARQILVQSRELARRGHRVFVVQRTDPALRTDPERAEAWSHVDVCGAGRLGGGETGGRGFGSRLRGLGFVALGLVRLWQLRNRIDVLHAHQLYSPTLLGALGKRLLLKPLVTKVTSSGELGERAELGRLPFRRARRLALRQVDRLLVLTPRMAGEMLGMGFPEARIRLLPNAVEIPSEPETRDASPDSPFRLLFTGRLSTEKRLDTLLEAAGLLARNGHRLRVDLVGAGDPSRDATPRLQQMAERMPEGVAVRFHGQRRRVAPYYRDADAFVLPSSTEGLSNALLEAMAHGLPCIVSDIPPNRFAVGHAGLTFSVGSAEELARRIDELIRDRASGGELAERLSKAAGRRAREEFSVEAVVDRLEEVYREVARTP